MLSLELIVTALRQSTDQALNFIKVSHSALPSSTSSKAKRGAELQDWWQLESSQPSTWHSPSPSVLLSTSGTAT